ncbi:MFS family permease [Parabacteroides sp. PF5-5]|uniref:MFS transporter n=1 Tax=unclassified Parabacteroides TaxID=2649774 RepID=UPI0024743B4D|nr:MULTISPECIES: MFS transporter [unclassified Parabacteroides]MDH6304691.1 MFS family permease [Parabacteroides sp. PH5-39]MDH6315695.1 MFS family permease [Parabacteroides sp. PF5-13]MDH6319355.1 MFS family permease [Parabacteroides sp. PH5-13]MDH6323086.1 MFS family permease [Parabacteroides sp. PH5-8]MDH6326888.1 MFS family permease [Parabacteroides sp. PH5-41]
MRRNILSLYLIKLSKWFTLVMPIIVLFYGEHGLGLQDVFILKSVYSIVAVTLEIPSGYLADVWGRRKCLILGCILFFCGYLCYSFTFTFAAFLVAEVLLGAGQTLVNGADSALLYDTTVHYKKENLYLRYEGRITMIGNFAEAVAGIIGGLLAAYSLRLPFYGQAVIAFTGIPAAFALKEIRLADKTQNPLSEILRIIKYSLFTNRKLCYNIMFSGVIGAATLTMAWFVQPLLIYLETPTSYFGIIWTVLNLTVGIAALYSDRIEERLGMKRSNILILVFIVGGYVALAYNLSYLGLAVLWVFYIFRGFATPILKGYINQLTFSDMRATVLSIRNFVIRLMFAAIAPFIGWLNDAYSLQTALLVSSLVIFIPGLLFLLLQIREEV